MRIGKWIINLRLPWVVTRVTPTEIGISMMGGFVKMISSEAIQEGMAVMVTSDGRVSPRTPENEILGCAMDDSVIDSDGKHTVVIRLGGVS